MICEKIRIKRKKLCSGDLQHLVQIMERTQVAPDFESLGPEEVFEESARIFMAIRTVSGKSFINGIQTLPETTHVFYCRRSEAIEEMDITKTFFLLSGKYYRVLKSEKINEDNFTLLIQCEVRGDSAKEAAEA